jgi:tetratricopeptide (TPR) repeat protein
VLKVALGAAAALIVIAGLLLYLGKLRWFARGLGIVGFLIVIAVLVLVQVQTVVDRQDPTVVATRPRYAQPTRRLAGAALIALPAGALLVMVSVWTASKRWLRSQVPRHLKAGRKHFFKKDYDAALQEYNQAIQIAPYLGEAYVRRGCVYQAMGDSVRALADFDRAIESDPRLAKAYLERGKIRTQSGELDGALEDFGRLVAIRAQDPELYLNRGICLLKKGLRDDAIADFELVLKLTNHSDFADPAKDYLRQCGEPASPAPVTQPNPNGPAAPGESTRPKAENHVL